MQRYFIIGTDTDCGKTYVTCQLIRYFLQQSQRVLAIKPVASGCLWQDALLCSEDYLQFRALLPQQPLQSPGYRFAEAAAPHILAERANQVMSVPQILQWCTADETDRLLIESAGGLMMPINRQHTWLDVLQHLSAQVILVVGVRLGAINHTLLTAHALQTFNIPCLGWIANCLYPDMAYIEENIDIIRAKLPYPKLATVWHHGQLTEIHPILGSS